MILVLMYVTSLYTNIPQVEGINIVSTAYENYYRDASLPLIPKPLLEKAPGRNLLQFKEQKYLKKRTDPLRSPKRQWLLQKSSWLKSKRKSSIKNVISLLVWKRYIDDIISRLLTNRRVFAMLENFVDY